MKGGDEIMVGKIGHIPSILTLLNPGPKANGK